MVSLNDIDIALARAEALMPELGRSPAQDEQVICLSNARDMVRVLSEQATASLDSMSDTLERLSDVTKGP